MANLYAVEADSQAAKVSFSKRNVTILDVIREIEQQTDYLFVYNKSEININGKVSVHANGDPVSKILDNLFRNTDIVYAMEGNNIMLKRRDALQVNAAPQSGQQADRQLRGTVKDERGEALMGVNVSVKGSSTGTITDLDGNFSLSVPARSELVVSYIGYVTQTIAVGASTQTLNIVLKENIQALNEVVVVGFGTQKKVNLSGSVAAVDVSELAEKRPITNITNALAGTVSGLNVTSTNNRPGDDNASLSIRGVGTLNNSSPLVIIDGMEGNLNTLNVQDVENISVLKDAASSAIYGSRAANGVILVTTKSGKAGSIKASYNGYVSFQSITPNVLAPVSNYADYMGLINEAFTNSKQLAPFSAGTISAWRNDNGKNPLMYPNTDWIESAFQTGVGTNHTVSMSGGTDKLQFYGAFGYFNNPGVLENSGYSRYSGRANITANIRPWLKMGVNLNGYVGQAEPGNAGQSANSESGETIDPGAFRWGWATTPAMILRHDGKFGGIQNAEDDVSESTNNILYTLNSTKGTNKTRNSKARFFAALEPLKGLSITGSYSYEYTDQAVKTLPVFNDTWNFGTNQIITKGKGQTYVQQKDYKTERSYMDLVAKYNTKFASDRLDFGVMVGGNQEMYQYEWMNVKRLDLSHSSMDVLNGATGQISAGGNRTAWAMQSFFGRVNLGWEEKYLLEVNFRADASSRFQPGRRWGYFPSASGAWRISQEKFMENVEWLNNLKIRASYGTLGNNAVGNYQSSPAYGLANYIINGGVNTGVATLYLANAAMEWERTNVANVGFDFNVLNNRLSGTVDYFNKYTSGILIALPAPGVHGSAGIPPVNAAEVSNNGVELTLGWNDRAGDFTYGVNVNYTYVKNRVEKFKGNQREMNPDNIHMIQEGYPINSLFMYKTDRIIQTDADVAYVQSMVEKNPDAFKTFGSAPQKGDILFADTDGNGIINSDDRVVVGNPNPEHLFGMNLNVGYKGFDFSIFFQGVAGVKDYFNEKYFTTVLSGKGYQMTKEIADNHWSEGVTDAKYPRLTLTNAFNDQKNSTWVQNKSYLKIRNIQLGYTLPKSVLEKIKIEKIRLYGSLENFFTFTSYKGIDPELNNLSYPTMRQAVIGVNVEF